MGDTVALSVMDDYLASAVHQAVVDELEDLNAADPDGELTVDAIADHVVDRLEDLLS